MILDYLGDFMTAEYSWILALSIAFGLALVMTLIMNGDEMVFVTLLLVFIAFMVWGNLIEGWVLILSIILYVIFLGGMRIAKKDNE